MKLITVVAAAIVEGLDILIVRRGPGQSGAGEWEFPGGKPEHEESFETALHREITEELGISIIIQSKIGEHKHLFQQIGSSSSSGSSNNKMIHLHLYLCKLAPQTRRDDIVLTEHDGQRWLPIQDLSEEGLSEPDRPFVRQIKENCLIQEK